MKKPDCFEVAPGRPLAYHYCSGSAPLVVLIHGALSDRRYWQPQWQFLCDRRLAVLACDLAGHGQSGWARGHLPAHHAQDLAVLLKKLALRKPPLLVGHSYGVTVAVEYARRYPVHGLFALGGGVTGLTPWWEKPFVALLESVGRHSFRLPPVGRAYQKLGLVGSSPATEPFLRQCLPPSHRTPYRAMRDFWDYDGRAGLERITAPVLIAAGEKDPVFTPAMAHTQAALFPAGRAAVIPSCGHLLMIEASDWVNAQIVQMHG
ncbi:alpha/beta fold hydrolase [Gloeobacter kilaueensis]|uniref:Alpha/beta hydrolase fold protein n=1 Tax=Gloeobacter kilaueensis (strain ATCC BAA-2537 / CCAP 1431/1 / ULC 316 / JS1) TaxID=1183438 RepID=U5QF67_GLOK1|nr:alpha/beta hydrolase [Gloeobacter kilaueensis]AGY57576.1 alpha/beta hydrolase fold protein [Gloeobacter kilaueensis JS1]